MIHNISVNDFLSVGSVLHVPNVDPYDGYVRFGGYLDNVWFRGKDNIIEQVVVLQSRMKRSKRKGYEG